MVYISLQQASKLCPYSQAYLSLRARQGKLKAVKLGRNWVCTKEWLQEYVAKVERLKPGFKHKKAGLRAVEPPRNLPIYAPDAEMWEEEIPADIARQKEFQRKFQFALAVALVAALFVGSIFQGREQVFRVAERVNPAVIASAMLLQEVMQEKGFMMGNEVQAWQAAGVGEIAKNYFAWLGEQVRRVAQIFQQVEKPMTQSLLRAESRGVVVVPSSDDDEKIKEQIKQSFSDEVLVTPYDKETGIITPIFRERRGEDYLYILVPIQNSPPK